MNISPENQSLEFDPLDSDQKNDFEVVYAAKKREIRNILKSYVGIYDTFSELIQNAMDAVDKQSIHQEPAYRKKLWIRIDLQKNQLSITDNGVAFNEKEFKAFLAPNISFKDGSKTRGHKGVGATYIAYGFNYLQLGTKSANFEYTGELISGNQWVEDNQGIVTRPIVKASSPIDPVFFTIGRGSTFTLRFDSSTRPKSLSWFMATTPEQWLYLLLIKTPLGTVNLGSPDCSDIYFDLTVIDNKGEERVLADQQASYIYPHLKIKGSCDLKDILKVQQQLHLSGRDLTKLPSKYEKLNGIYEFFNTSELKKLPTQKIDDKEDLIDRYQITAYCFFTYSTSVWDNLNDDLAKLRKGYRVLRGGLQLANNGMVQGEIITIPLTSNIGYQNQAHIIVHFTNADPDLGRKGFQPELKSLAEDISVGIVNRVKKWKKQLKRDTGARPVITSEIELHRWIRDQEKHEESYPLILSNPNFFLPIKEVSISSHPQSEQDVVVLFNQLVAGGVIRGIKLMATSQYAQYDSLFKFTTIGSEINYIFDKQSNPLGVEYLGLAVGQVSPPKILEYKYNVDALISEFNNEEKNERDVNLVVAWELGEEWSKSYSITSLLDLDNLHHRQFHGITHVLESNNNNRIYIVILKELVEYLSDVDGVQDYHKSQYGDDLFF